ncbi:hypothetical protein Ddye_031740 [Dipteronia dyeriana]|uniref:Serine protease n=1 Tax=Dipteronia dyeriana TaxID=168575 RepID=A0AAD9WNY5_9ROSI|nr:hypothetical protein Ddye_031740 [Dipteronia dyeriana]
MRNPIMPLFALLFIVFVIDKQSLMPRMVDAKSNVHIVYLGEKQHDDNKLVVDSHHQMLAEIVGSKEEASKLMVYSYKHGFSGFAAKLTDSQALQLSEFPGVIRVIQNRILSLKTTRSWDFLGLSSHSPNLLHTSNMGEDLIVGLLDTGLWPELKAFSDEGLGPIPSHWKGDCESGDQFIRQCASADILKAFDEAIHDGVDVISLSIAGQNPLFSEVDEQNGIATVDFNVGTQILLYVRSSRSPVVKLSPAKTFVGQPLSANVAYFSSWGPNSIAPAILKPDVAAPGVNIITASSPLGQYFDNGFDMLTGTSMATPHASGIVALLKSAHPDWSPAATKSALVTTAWKNGPSGSPIFAHGASQKLADLIREAVL